MDDLAVVIFGATGDLTHKKLVPALAEIYKENPCFHLIGFARRDISEQDFRESFRGDKGVDDGFLSIIQYHKGDFLDIENYKTLRQNAGTDNLLFYLAVDPESFPAIIANIKESGLNTPKARIIVEKPFGTDQQTARELYEQLHTVFAETQIYIIDHYVGKETIQNILAFRFGNGIFEQQWSREYIDSIQITVAEDIGINGRGGYYDNAGALKDMVQSHILQILAAIAMEAPATFNPFEIHRERAKLITSLRKHSMNDIDSLKYHLVLGQYNGYLSEEKVRSDSHTETFAALKTYIDNPRWADVPIYIRTGKKLPLKVTEAYIQFKKPLQHLFGEQHRNVLAFRLQPNEGISLKVSLKEPGREMDLKEVSMDFCYNDTFTISDNSYIRLLEDAINNNQSLFTSIDEIIASWEFIEPFMSYTTQHPERVSTYEPNTWGPEESQDLIAKDDRHWLSLYPYKCDINIKL